MAKAKGKSKGLQIDFGGVDKEIRSGGRRAHVPEGDYLVKIVKAELRKSEKKGKGRFFSWRFQIVEPKKYKGKTLYDITSLKPDALWNLRNLIFAALGKNVAGKALNFNPEKLYGKVVMVTVEDEEYEKKINSNIVDYQPRDQYGQEEDDDEDEDDDEEVEEEDESEEDDDDDDEDLDEVDVDEL